MKRIFNIALVMLFASLTLVSCSKKYSLTIENLPPQAEGQKFFLSELTMDENGTVDTAIIKDGMARFEGKISEPRLMVLNGQMPIIIEACDMHIDAQQGGAVTGSPLNDKVKAFGEEMQKFQQSETFTAAIAQMQDSTVAESVKDSLNTALTNMFKEKMMQGFKENNKTLVANIIFLNGLMRMPLTKAELDDMLDGACDGVKNFEFIKNAYENAEAMAAPAVPATEPTLAE